MKEYSSFDLIYLSVLKIPVKMQKWYMPWIYYFFIKTVLNVYNAEYNVIFKIFIKPARKNS